MLVEEQWNNRHGRVWSQQLGHAQVCGQRADEVCRALWPHRDSGGGVFSLRLPDNVHEQLCHSCSWAAGGKWGWYWRDWVWLPQGLGWKRVLNLRSLSILKFCLSIPSLFHPFFWTSGHQGSWRYQGLWLLPPHAPLSLVASPEAIIGPMLATIARSTCAPTDITCQQKSTKALAHVMTFAAGTCLTSPLGYQTNLMVPCRLAKQEQQ